MPKFPELDSRFDDVLAQHVTKEEWSDYLKWARFYLDFCGKYGHESLDMGSILTFIKFQMH